MCLGPWRIYCLVCLLSKTSKVKMNDKFHVVSMVFNAVKGDSRVIKTAQAALNLGCRATIVGVTSSRNVEHTEVEGVSVVLVPNFSAELKKSGLWGEYRHDLRLLIGGFLQSAIPQIVELRPSLLHSHDMFSLKIGISAQKALAADGYSVPWVHDLHEFVAGLKGEIAEKYFMPICLDWEREYLHLANHLFTVSDALALEIQNRYFLSNLPTVTYNTPNLKFYNGAGEDVRSAIGLDKKSQLVAFVGGATQLRGCDTILDAVSMVDGVHIVFISQGPYVEEMHNRAKLLGMANRFHVHPYVSIDTVSSFIRTANIGIHGLVHYPNAEVAMPNKMFEYLHAGLPMVVSDVACMKEFVENNGIGLSFIAGDAVSCAEKIRSLLDQESIYRKAITPELQTQYSWEQQEEKIQSVYQKFISKKFEHSDYVDRDAAFNWCKYDNALFDNLLA